MTFRFDGVIFDLDGTLVSSELNFQQMRLEIGCPAQEDILTFIEQLPDQIQQEKAHTIIRNHELQDAHTAVWLPGAQQLVSTLHALQVPMAIVTRNFSQAARIKLNNNRMPINTLITREDAPAKPNPTALLQIAEDWQIKPERIVYIGDFRYDVEAANNANMVSCLYAPGVLPDYAHTADLVIEHFDQLIPVMHQPH
ncbi:HAD family hydrolase [Oceanospirillum beijerinckii]|uniref:HAD family hydrolase n=1 Tax=Oceanospirillum beijerinckii TaxID=64976 RepID=UPI000400900B|nr:HAD-IA family hydrolase [Oceanospirillum beijerinckii]MAC46833.1 HAD family hydrolase [Oceanospirillum sp.]